MHSMKIPKVLFLETSNSCTRHCKFCYWGYHTRPDLEIMDLDLYRRILSDVKSYTDTLIAINLFLINEPTLDPLLLDRVRLVREEFGRNQLIRIFANGDKLDPEVHKTLNRENVFLFIDKTKCLPVPVNSQAGFLRGKISEELQPPMLDGLCLKVRDTIVIRHDGSMIFCCVDMTNASRYANANDGNVVELWNTHTTDVGESLSNRKRHGIVPCELCEMDTPVII